MFMLTPIIAIMLSVFSTAVMSYIAMATPIGPWIAPTLVLIALLIFKLVMRSAVLSTDAQQSESAGSQTRGSANSGAQAIVLVTVAGSIGGILATGIGFSFPTLYFADPELFNFWLSRPAYFISMLGGISCAAGFFGFLLANIFEYKVIEQENLPFPISVLIHKMIAAGNNLRKAYELIAGFLGTIIFCFFQEGAGFFQGVLPKSIQLMPSLLACGVVRIPAITFDLWPMLWAIGFITGHVIAVPLAVGALARIALVDPLNALWFCNISAIEFSFAFCSGMVLFGALESLIRMPRMIRQFYAWIAGAVSGVQANTQAGTRVFDHKGRDQKNSDKKTGVWRALDWQNIVGHVSLPEQLCLLVFVAALLLVLGFSWFQVFYLLALTAIFTYQMVVIAGKWGIAPLGRFATFVMLPAMLFFSLDITRIVYIATFVEVCGGVAVDILFGRGVARKSGVDKALVKRYQYLGLAVSALTVGVACWMLIKACGLGSAQLFAYKAQSRHLLINALLNGKSFSWIILVIGALFSFLLARCGLNAMLVMGGLLMPLNLSLGLIFGGILTYLVRDRQEWEPLWSGVFAANSIWMLLKAIL
jgi:hypothetical protein